MIVFYEMENCFILCMQENPAFSNKYITYEKYIILHFYQNVVVNNRYNTFII